MRESTVELREKQQILFWLSTVGCRTAKLLTVDSFRPDRDLEGPAALIRGRLECFLNGLQRLGMGYQLPNRPALGSKNPEGDLEICSSTGAAVGYRTDQSNLLRNDVQRGNNLGGGENTEYHYRTARPYTFDGRT